ncbi:MAG TPA: palindromic element RPE4 domain-containing protein [Rickettsia endosymbiont of Ceroptres masudai]|nr:palindromic element RPE4 domain-containing protein [Rickettsia endosymbiont of Ceroptres masudai]
MVYGLCHSCESRNLGFFVVTPWLARGPVKISCLLDTVVKPRYDQKRII